MYFAFIYSRIKYGIEVYGSCSSNQLHRLQVVQSGLLKLLLKKERRTNTNALHSEMKLLKVTDIYKLQLIMFVNNCSQGRLPRHFRSYFNTRISEYNLRNLGLEPAYGRIGIGYFTVKNTGSRLWNEIPEELKHKAKQLNFRKHVAQHLISSYIEL